MLLKDPALRSCILPYLTVRELIKLRQVSKDLRQWIRSPLVEKQSLTRCLKQCYGLYDIAYEAKTRRCYQSAEVPTWLDLEMILSLEADQVERMYLEERSLGTTVFNRVSLPGAKEKELLFRYLNIDRLRGGMITHGPNFLQVQWCERCDLYKLEGDASLVDAQSTTKLIKTLMPKITRGDLYHPKDEVKPTQHPKSYRTGLGYAYFQAPGASSAKHPAIQFSDLLKITPYAPWTQRIHDSFLAEPYRCHPDVPREAAVPFYLRVALEDSALLERLVDVEDQELTPTQFWGNL